MLHITAILEDTQIVLTYDQKDQKWRGSIADGMTGRQVEVKMSSTEISSLFAVALHPDGEPVAVEDQYNLLKAFLKKYGMERGGENVACRPIP